MPMDKCGWDLRNLRKKRQTPILPMATRSPCSTDHSSSETDRLTVVDLRKESPPKKQEFVRRSSLSHSLHFGNGQKVCGRFARSRKTLKKRGRGRRDATMAMRESYNVRSTVIAADAKDDDDNDGREPTDRRRHSI